MFFSSTPNVRVLSWNGYILATEDSEDWNEATSVQNIVCDDVDNDGVVEIITAGYTAGMMLTPKSELGIWSISQVASSITVTLSPPSIVTGRQVTISGTLTSGQMVTITLTYTMPNGTTITKTVVSTSTGTFTNIIKLDQAGIWQVKASCNGNEQYESTVSTPITVTAKTVDQTTPILAMGGLGLGLIALIIAIAGIYIASRKKTSTPPPSPTTTEVPPTPTI